MHALRVAPTVRQAVCFVLTFTQARAQKQAVFIRSVKYGGGALSKLGGLAPPYPQCFRNNSLPDFRGEAEEYCDPPEYHPVLPHIEASTEPASILLTLQTLN